MQRRRYLRAAGGCLGAVSLSDCTGVLSGGDQSPEYPGGPLLVENTGDSSVLVSVQPKLAQYDASLDAGVAPGETAVRRAFVTAERGDVVTFEARLGETGELIRVQFLPAGGDDGSPPEVARLTFEDAVEASATWTATSGTSRP